MGLNKWQEIKRILSRMSFYKLDELKLRIDEDVDKIKKLLEESENDK